jgi:hypothetical protein
MAFFGASLRRAPDRPANQLYAHPDMACVGLWWWGLANWRHGDG